MDTGSRFRVSRGGAMAQAAIAAMVVVVAAAAPSMWRTGRAAPSTAPAARSRSGLPAARGLIGGFPVTSRGAESARSSPRTGPPPLWTASYLSAEQGCNGVLYCYPDYWGGGQFEAISPDGTK